MTQSGNPTIDRASRLDDRTSTPSHAYPANVTRLIRWSAAVSVAPGVALPLYNVFLHGPRYASSIVTRSTAYTEAHMLGAIVSLLLMFGVVAIYLTVAQRSGGLGVVSVMVALFAQAGWAGILFVDGIMNPLLSHFDPVTQTNLHSPQFASTVSHSYLWTMWGPAGFTPDALQFVYLIGFVLFGIAIIRANVLPRVIGVLFIAGSLPLSIALMLPQWVESLGYAAIGLGFVWAGLLIWRSRPETAGSSGIGDSA